MTDQKAGRPLQYPWTTTPKGDSFLVKDRTGVKGRKFLAERYNVYKSWMVWNLRHKKPWQWTFEQKGSAVLVTRIK